MKRKLIVLFAALVATRLLAAPAAPRVSARDSEGRLVELAASAGRIVSLSPAATEVLFAIGAGSLVCGDTEFCDYPVAALAIPKIGGFAAKTISVELILELRPNLVVSSGSMHRQIEEQLTRYSIPVFSYDPGDFDGIARDMRALGVLTGTTSTAEAAVSAMLASLESIAKRIAPLAPADRPTVFWEMYDEPLTTCGWATFQHAIIAAAGGRDIFEDLHGSWPTVSSEEVIRRAPDYIVGADDHGDKLSVAQIVARPGWASVPAVRSGRVVLVPADLVSRPTPRIAEGVAAVAYALHPGLFP